MRHFILTLCYISLLIFSPPRVLADTGLKISPASLDLLIQPGVSLIKTLTLTNLGDPATLRVSLHRLIPLGLNGGSTIDPTPLSTTNFPLTLRIDQQSLSDFSYDLPSSSPTPLTLELKTAAAETAQDLYLALVFHLENPAPLASQPLISLPILVSLSPNGDLATSLSLDNFSPPFISDNATPLTLTPQVKNNAPQMIRPHGQLTIRHLGTETIIPLAPELVLSQTSRTLAFAAGDARTQGYTLPAGFGAFGRYDLTLTLTTPGGQVLTTAQVSLYRLPLRAVALSVFCLAILTLLLWRRQPRARD